jgi:hypothetical protein
MYKGFRQQQIQKNFQILIAFHRLPSEPGQNGHKQQLKHAMPLFVKRWPQQPSANASAASLA